MQGYFSFQGMAGRASFVGAIVLMLAIIVCAWALGSALGVGVQAASDAVWRALFPPNVRIPGWLQPGPWLMVGLLVAAAATSLWITAAAFTRRIRDLGLSGWHAAWVVPGFVALGWVKEGGLGTVATVVSWAVLLLLAVIPGRTRRRASGGTAGEAA